MDPIWKPLLEGQPAARAREAVCAIAEALAVTCLPSAWRTGPWEGSHLASLSLGAPGPALLFGYLARSGLCRDSERPAALAELYLDEAASALATTPMSIGLFSGFSGVAWASQHLSRLLGLAGDANGEIDDILLKTLAQPPWRGDFDLGTGLAGIGVYALERLPRATAVRCLVAVVERLTETASIGERGVTWQTRPDLLPPHRRQEEPLGYFNLGVAHGVPGAISFLADACHVEPCAHQARYLLEGAVRWLLEQPRTGRPGFSFGKWISPSRGLLPAPRLGWCYGDPGVAGALLYAARTIGDARWEAEALEIGRRAALVPCEEAGIADPALCHGAIGLAHLYNRLYQATQEEIFAAAARSWYHEGLKMRNEGEGIAGFCSLPGSGATPGWAGDPGLITGASGIALGLLAAISDHEPEWDRLLRIAIPPVVLTAPANTAPATPARRRARAAP